MARFNQNQALGFGARKPMSDADELAFVSTRRTRRLKLPRMFLMRCCLSVQVKELTGAGAGGRGKMTL